MRPANAGALISMHLPRDYWERTLEGRFLAILRTATRLAWISQGDEMAWVEINDLAGPLKFHTPAQRKHRLIALGHDIRCECRPSRYTDKKVWKYRLYEEAQVELFTPAGGPAR
jgi:hypothetical protein